MTVKHICIILLILASNSLHAQDTLLLGKWQLVEMQKDSVIIFNRDDIEITIEDARNRNKPLDSIEIQKYREVTHPMMKKMFYHFFDNGSLIAGVLDLKDGKYLFIEKNGAFRTDGGKVGIGVEGGNDDYTYSIEGNVLTLTPIIGGEIYT